MNHGNDDLEAELRALQMRRPPAEWKAILLAPASPPPPVPWLPKPLTIFLTGCWLTAGGLWLATPDIPDSGAPKMVLPPPSDTEEFLLGYNPPGDLMR